MTVTRMGSAAKASSDHERGRSVEERWFEMLSKPSGTLEQLFIAGVVDPMDSQSLRKSNDQVVVGTIAESTEVQRNGLLFSRPTSRQELLDSLKP